MASESAPTTAAVRRGTALRVAVLGLCLAAAIRPASANIAVLLNYSAREMPAPITVDGKLDEWQGVEPVLLAGEAHWEAARPGEAYGGPGDAAAKFYLAWDDKSLYVAVEAYDDELSPPSDASRMLEGDCVAVAIDARNDAGQGYGEDDSEIGFCYSSTGALTWRWFPTERAGPVYSAKVAVVREVKPGALDAGMPPLKLTYEASVPWFELPRVQHETGRVFGLNLAFHDVDDGRRHGWLQWSPGMMGIKDPSQFGNAHFAGPLPARPPEPREEPTSSRAAEPVAPLVPGISFDRRSFTINGREILLYSGAFHYFRCPKPEWGDRLNKMQAAGLNCVSTFVPWNWHEPREGKTDLADLDEFLSLAESLKLHVIVQPGPYVGADWSGGGLPSWLSPKGLRYRSATPEFLAWCEHWFDEVMPVIARHQISEGGGVIMVQLEHELRTDAQESWGLLSALHAMARNSGITVPLVTTATPAARDNSDPAMADITDAVRLERAWGIALNQGTIVEASVREDSAPALVSELPTGRALAIDPATQAAESRDESGLTRMLAVAALEVGADLVNYYMGCAGTNPGYWGDPGIATAYDCGAPIAEHGGLRDEYYAVKGIGDFLADFGPMLASSWRLPEGAAFADQDGVSVVERISGESAFIFLRDESDLVSPAGTARHLRVTYTDPLDGRQVTIPTAGRVMLPHRGAKILVAGLALPHGRLEYCTSEIAGLDAVADRRVLVVHGEPGEPGELRVRLDAPPALGGDPVNSVWDSARRALTISYRFGDREQHVVMDPLELVIAPTARALRSWKVAAAADTIRVISDAYLLGDAAADENGLEMTFELRPGDANFTAVMPRAPSEVRIDGTPAPFAYDPVTRVVGFGISTPALDYRPPRRGGVLGKIRDILTAGSPSLRQSFSRARATIEPLTEESGWRQVELKPLQELDVFDAGYVTYHATFDTAGRSVLSVDAYAPDAKLVYVNGRFVGDLSQPMTQCTSDVSELLRAGDNTIDIIYHNLGWPAEGPRMGETKGLRAVHLRQAGPSERPSALPGAGSEAGPGEASQTDQPVEVPVEGWRIRARLQGEIAGFHLPQYSDASWNILPLGEWRHESRAMRDFEGITWYRVAFAAPQREGWQIPWKLRVDAAEQTMIYLNGHLLGKHFAGGAQSEFHLPQAQLRPRGKNVLAFAVRSGDSGGGLRAATVEPYDDFVARRTHVEIRY
ncbi:MAG: beta-galactosidase [Armatimonadota bacterium]|nr:MAG: beta-galactosidase [Armatimonadota bacterium]